MTEHDRGAYTPTPDAPLQFDARGAYRRKPIPMTLIGSGAVLAVLIGALALHYRHDTKPAHEARTAAAPSAEVKSAAPALTPTRDAGAGPGGAVDVFGGPAQVAQAAPPTAPSAAGKAPIFAPPPEAPSPGIRLKVQTLETASPRTARLATAATPANARRAAPAPGYHAPDAVPATVAASASPPSASAVIASIADSPPARPAAAAAPAPASGARSAASVFGGAMVQIGAFSSMSLSEKGWTDVSAAMGPQMSGKLKRVEAIEKGGKTYYRTSVTGFPSREAASAFCRTLSAKGFDCFAKG